MCSGNYLKPTAPTLVSTNYRRKENDNIKKQNGDYNDFCDNDDGEAQDVWGNEDYLFIQDSFGIEVLDISDPANPYEIFENNKCGGHEIYSDGNYVYVATGQKGMIILLFKKSSKESLIPGLY